MSIIPIIAQCVIGSLGFAIDPQTVQCLNAHGLSSEKADFGQAIDKAFARSDVDLFLGLAITLDVPECASKYADQIIRLYQVRPDDTFKKAIGPRIASELSLETRVVQSRWGCTFLDLSIEALFSPKENSDRLYALSCLRRLSIRRGLDTHPYLLKAALCFAQDNLSSVFLRECCSDSISPAEAFYIFKLYRNRYGYEKKVDFFAQRAQQYLTPSETPPLESLEEVVKALDAKIVESRKDFCAEYGEKEMESPAPKMVPKPGLIYPR